MAVVTRWFWVRHAPVINPDHIVYGASDMPVDVSETHMFAPAARALPRGEDVHWLTSTAGRTHRTRDAIIREGYPAITSTEDARFAEQGLGDWEGLTWEEALPGGEQHPFWHTTAEYRPPNGESFTDVIERVLAGVRHWTAAFRGRDIVCVAHGGVIRAMATIALGMAPDKGLSIGVDNCSISRFDWVEYGEAQPKQAWRTGYLNLSPRKPDGFANGAALGPDERG